MMSSNTKIFGIDETPVSRALAEALWNAGPRGKVFTGCESCAADYRETHGWVLHNTAWWNFGGAHNVVYSAAGILEQMAPEFREMEKSVLGDELDDEDHVTPAEEAIWEVANTSFRAWRERQRLCRIEREAKAAGLPIAVYLITQPVNGLEVNFAMDFVAKFGDELALSAVAAFSEAVSRLHCDAGPNRVADHACLKPYRSPGAGSHVIRDGYTVAEFGREYLSALFYTERHTICNPDWRKSRFEVIGLGELSNFVGDDDSFVDKIIDALEMLLNYYGLEQPIAEVYRGNN